MITRENEESKDALIKEYESNISSLKAEVVRLRKNEDIAVVEGRVKIHRKDDDVVPIVDIYEEFKKIKTTQLSLRNESLRMFEDYKTEMCTVFKQQLNSFITKNNLKAFSAGITQGSLKTEECSSLSAVSDNEELFVPNQKRQIRSTMESTTIGPSSAEESDDEKLESWKKRYQHKEKQIEKLQKCLEEKEKSLIRKENIHKIEIDTLVQSLTKKPPENNRYQLRLTPSTHLNKIANRMGQTEFLQQCLAQLNKNKGICEIQSAPEQ